MTSIPGRAAVVAIALAGLAFGLSWRADAASCEHHRQSFLKLALREQATADDARSLADHCADTEQLAAVAAGYARTDRALAEQLAEVAVDRAPETFAPWAALALSRPAGSAGALVAWRRAKALNPRWTLPAPR